LPESAITTGATDAPSTAAPAAPAVPAGHAAATARKAELLGNAEWRGKFLENDPACRAEMSALNRAIVGPDPAAAPVDEHVLEHARSMGVSDAVVEQIKKGEPVSQYEHDMVQRWKDSHMRDAAFLRKFFDGDYEARQKMFLANVTLSLPIKQA
jgi:hypothetical protein